MILAIHILILLSSPRYGLQNFLISLGSIVGYISWKLLSFLGLCFAMVVNCFFFAIFFVLFIGPGLLRNRSSPNIASDGNDGWNDVEKTNGIPDGWVKVRVCKTDEISEFYLDEDTDRTVVPSGKKGEWEERDLMDVTKEEIDRKVWAWLRTLNKCRG